MNKIMSMILPFARGPSLTLLFLVFINDIADEPIGLCRLFADDKSIAEKSYKMNSLCNMVNTDIKNISEWSKQWLVKLNPTKTDIVYFNTTSWFVLLDRKH